MEHTFLYENMKSTQKQRQIMRDKWRDTIFKFSLNKEIYCTEKNAPYLFCKFFFSNLFLEIDELTLLQI